MITKCYELQLNNMFQDIKLTPSIPVNIRLRKKVKALKQQLKRRDKKIKRMANVIAELKEQVKYCSQAH